MSEPDRSSSRGASRVATVVMIVAGIILLLPGLCAGFSVSLFLHDRRPGQAPIDPQLLALWFVCFAIAAGDVALISWAVLRPRCAGARETR